jgi:hypothetical protein
MTTETLPNAVRGWNRPLLVLTAATAVLTVVTAIGLFTDSRIVTGAPVWLKPFKFAVSFAIYGFTLSWLLSVLPRRSRPAEWAAALIFGVSVIELAIITLQAGRGRMSHFNETTPLDAQLFAIMGASIMVLFMAHVAIAVVALRQRIGDRAVTCAIRSGLLLSVLGLLAAVPMVAGATDRGDENITGGHSVGVADGGPGMPLTGWSLTGGDLRIGHFVGLHGLQALPLLAFLLSRYLGRRLDTGTRARLLLVAGLAYGVLVVLLTWQALRAQPLLRPDALTLTVLAALLAATGVATTLVLRKRRPELALAA